MNEKNEPSGWLVLYAAAFIVTLVLKLSVFPVIPWVWVLVFLWGPVALFVLLMVAYPIAWGMMAFWTWILDLMEKEGKK